MIDKELKQAYRAIDKQIKVAEQELRQTTMEWEQRELKEKLDDLHRKKHETWRSILTASGLTLPKRVTK